MSFRLLSEEEIEQLALVVNATKDAFLFRVSSAESLCVFNLPQLKDILKTLRVFFPREKLTLYGNKMDLVHRVVDVCSRCVPAHLLRRQLSAPAPAASSVSSAPPRSFERRLDNSMLPLAAVARAQPQDAVPLLAVRSFDGSGLSEEMFRACQAPNWHIVEILGVAPVRFTYSLPSSEVKTFFEWKKDSKECLVADRANTQVQLRVLLLDGGKDARFRVDHGLVVNYQLIHSPLVKPPRKNLTEAHFAPPGIDVSLPFMAAVAPGQVSVSFQNTSQWSGILVAVVARRVSIEALAAVVPFAPLERERMYERLGRSEGGADGNDLTELSFTISLDDPLSLTRIVIPAQGPRCEHFQCFDLESFLQYSLEHSIWNCPVCNRPVPHKSLIRMQCFQRVLDNFPDTKQVICNPDGSFVAHEPEAQGKYERNITEKRKMIKAGKREAPVVQVLLNDEPTLKRAKESLASPTPESLMTFFGAGMEESQVSSQTTLHSAALALSPPYSHPPSPPHQATMTLFPVIPSAPAAPLPDSRPRPSTGSATDPIEL